MLPKVSVIAVSLGGLGQLDTEAMIRGYIAGNRKRRNAKEEEEWLMLLHFGHIEWEKSSPKGKEEEEWLMLLQ